jgi:phosphohistidine phosphatase
MPMRLVDMKNVLLMRHAKSSWKDASLPDHQRPLNRRGKHDAPRMGKFLQGQGILLDAILCSTAVRARQTATGLLKKYTFEGEIQYFDDLYQADPEMIISILNQLPEEVNIAMVIGHNPGMDDFLEMVCDECGHMPTASVAYIKYPIERWIDLRTETLGELIHLWEPKEI